MMIELPTWSGSRISLELFFHTPAVPPALVLLFEIDCCELILISMYWLCGVTVAFAFELSDCFREVSSADFDWFELLRRTATLAFLPTTSGVFVFFMKPPRFCY